MARLACPNTGKLIPVVPAATAPAPATFKKSLRDIIINLPPVFIAVNRSETAKSFGMFHDLFN
jgi:hypothetical protein